MEKELNGPIAIEELEAQAVKLVIANKELALQRKEKLRSSMELLMANQELVHQNEEKEKRSQELVIANKELAFQNKEKEKRASELVIANKELAFQNKEKENRASELIKANVELAFQNKEKEKRASELVIANKELAFQNLEKENRAMELIVANKELAFQNTEKEKRAAELLLANIELAFQNEEKEKRASELITANSDLKKAEDGIRKLNDDLELKVIERTAQLRLANRELAYQNKEKGKRANDLTIANSELQKAEEGIRKLNDDLEQKVKERTAELELVNQELESFSYSVSHDLRAPIRAINGYTSIFFEDYADRLGTDGLRILQSIMTNSRKMGNLIDDLLSFSKLGRKELIFQNLNMSRLVHSIREEIAVDEVAKSSRIEIKDLTPAQGDIALIKQVWLNLISNAIKYSQHQPQTLIEIGSFEEGEHTVYYVKDQGAGFDMQYYDKLFGVFQRLHSQEEFEGTGIGLAIVQKIVQRHNGRVWAQSKINEGACFYFSLHSVNPLIT